MYLQDILALERPHLRQNPYRWRLRQLPGESDPRGACARRSITALRASLTRVVPLGGDSIVVISIAAAGGNAAAIPPMAVTLGMKDILASRKIRLYCAGGERHRAIFRIAVAGEASADFPVTLVQGHRDAIIHIDAAGAQPVAARLR